MSDDSSLDLEPTPIEREIGRQMDAAIGRVPMSQPPIVPPTRREFPARALRYYGVAAPPILD